MAKIYVDGNGLALERFILQRQVGGAWQSSNIYMKDQRHRFRLLFRSYFSTGIPQMGAAFALSGVHIVDLRVSLRLPGARFEGDGDSSALQEMMPGQVDGHPDFNRTIAPSTSRWFEMGYFTWKYPSILVNNVLVDFCTFHREVLYIPFARRANLVASA